MSDRFDTHLPRLCDADIDVVDRVLGVDAEGRSLEDRAAALPPAEKKRAEALLALLGQLDQYPVTDADDALVDATLARVDRVDRDLASLPLQESEVSRNRLRFRVPDLVGLAAAVLLAVGIFLPVSHRIRQASLDAGCMNNLRLVGAANALYAHDHNGWLPIRAGFLPWDRSHGADNLALLEELEYCAHEHLGCPGHHQGAPHRGYAYRAMDHANRARIGLGPQSVLLADRSHIIDLARAGGVVTNLVVPSANHGHRGQHVLFGSLEVQWTTSPKIPGVRGGLDNIYLILTPSGTEDLTPGQRTLNIDDHFAH